MSEDTSGKQERRDEVLHQLGALPKDPNKSSETTLLTVERQANTALVLQRYHMTTRKTKPDGSPQDVDLVTDSEDTWLLSGDSWLVAKTVTKKLDYKVNGALVAHKEHP